MKNVFTIASNAAFLDTLAAELWRRANGDGLKLSQNLVLLPTRRACRHLGAAFANLAGDKPVLLPRLQPIGDSDEEEMAFADEGFVDLPPAISPLKRLMLLTQQVQKRDSGLSCDQAAQAAVALAKFLDQIQIERCDVSKLSDLVEGEDIAEHWRQVLHFLEIVTEHWPAIVTAEGCMDPAARRNAVLEAQANLWRKQPPSHPVIAAGSTGSLPATADLLEVIAGMERGAVILPGLDRVMDNEAWDAIGDTHPQLGMKRLLEKIGIDRETVKEFGKVIEPSARVRLISESMRPADVSEGWRGLRGNLGSDSVKGLVRIVLDHPQEEARVIALRLRALLEQKEGTASLVTSDRGLAQRVAALLRRWGIEVDDSAGLPLGLSPAGSFLNLILAAASPYARTADILALLKHPLAACGMQTVACRAMAREAELRIRRLEVENFADIRKLLQPLTKNWHGTAGLSERISTHIAVAESIASSDTEEGAYRLWNGEDGAATAAWLDEWRNNVDGFPTLNGGDYTALFGSLAASEVIRTQRTTHPRISILGPLEARLIHADLIVLGGLNEGSWPPDAGFDPWMSRPMRKKFGMTSPEFRIGLSAHDFAQLAASNEVMLTRSARAEGSPTVPSRFLLQLDAVLRAAGLCDGHDALTPKEPWQEWARLLDEPDEVRSCARPQPRPPVAVRPKAFSVTEISTWLRNPYAIYARHILKLQRLEELDAELGAADRGIMIHRALEKFAKTYPSLPNDAEKKLLEIGRSIFSADHGDPRVQAFWWARFVSVASWYIEMQRIRAASGVKLLQAEAMGSVDIGGIQLTGRADRIDRLSDGKLAITDYKTGGVPSVKQVESGLEPQLPLLALIAAKGGFKGIAAAETGALEYWKLQGGREYGEIIKISEDIPHLMREAETGVANLAAAFSLAKTAYEVSPRARFAPRYDDYGHLARVAEWGNRGEEE